MWTSGVSGKNNKIHYEGKELYQLFTPFSRAMENVKHDFIWYFLEMYGRSIIVDMLVEIYIPIMLPVI